MHLLDIKLNKAVLMNIYKQVRCMCLALLARRRWKLLHGMLLCQLGCSHSDKRQSVYATHIHPTACLWAARRVAGGICDGSTQVATGRCQVPSRVAVVGSDPATYGQTEVPSALLMVSISWAAKVCRMYRTGARWWNYPSSICLALACVGST